MGQTIIIGLFLLAVTILVFFKMRQVVRENREKRADDAFECRLVSALQSHIPADIGACLLPASLWVLLQDSATRRILSIGFQCPKSVDPASPLYHEELEIPPRILCFSSRGELLRFQVSLMGQLLGQNFPFGAAGGQEVLEEALRRDVPVCINPFGGRFSSVLELDAVRAILNPEA
jgi:hypothetical protein